MEKPPHTIMKHLSGLNIHVDKDADLAEETGDITPVIFSHGLFLNHRLHSSNSKELAANGCIVYAICHTDGTAPTCKDADGKVIPYRLPKEDPKKRSHPVFRRKQLEHRTDEIGELIEVIKEEAKELPIDISKLTMIGHSFGGTTAVNVAKTYPDDIKYVIPMDHWFQVHDKEVEEGKSPLVTQPMFFLTTERFLYRYDPFYNNHPTKDLINTMFEANTRTMSEDSKSKSVSLVMKDADHWNQAEWGLAISATLFLFGHMGDYRSCLKHM